MNKGTNVKKGRLSFQELIMKNKEEILKSPEQLEKIDKKIEDKKINNK
ncbi:FbpB family small basic protein [Bacillus pinisoli]|nr:FbpB family small basic protein [Bacillus pinisoli]